MNMESTTPQISVKLTDFRAIKNAELVLEGITVVAGENGCGKSTLSQLLYYTFKFTNEYERTNSVFFYPYFYKIRNSIEQINSGHPSVYPAYTQDGESFDSEEVISRIKELLLETNIVISTDKKPTSWDEARAKHIMLNEMQTLSQHILQANNVILDENQNISTIFEGFNNYVSLWIESYKKHIEKRFIQPVSNVIKELFPDINLKRNWHVSEFNTSILDWENDKVSSPYSINNIIYIDTPIMAGLKAAFPDLSNIPKYWSDLNQLLQKTKQTTINKPLEKFDQQISDLLSGKSSFDKKSGLFIYHRKDGKELNLLNCATGIKSFATLQMLLKNGYLNNQTLLIIDEPEAHLHPQWIVEYARLIVLLNKEIRVKFFISSHNPDMISALKYISEKEGVDNKLNFYLAEKSGEDEYMYNYKHLKTEIDPIFESFNIALDRINQYGGLTEE